MVRRANRADAVHGDLPVGHHPVVCDDARARLLLAASDLSAHADRAALDGDPCAANPESHDRWLPPDSNPVAAFPSMHVLTPLAIALWLSWKRLDAMAWVFWIFTAL